MTLDHLALATKQSIFIILNKLLLSDEKPVPLLCIQRQSTVASLFFRGFNVPFFSLFRGKSQFPCAVFLVVPLCRYGNRMRLPTGLNYVVCT